MKLTKCEIYEKKFNDKIDALKEHSKYEWLRNYSDEAITWHTGCGFLQIKAVDFMNRIIKMPLDYIKEWLDGKNDLEWKQEYR